MSEPVVVVTRQWPTEVEQELRRRFPTVRLSIDDRPLGVEGLRRAMEYADVVLPTVADQLPAEVFDDGIKTRFLGNFGVGVDHIDTEAARTAGVTVTNTPGVLTDATADLAMTLILVATRRVTEGEREVRARSWSGWRPTHLLGADLRGKTLGIIGMGRIGTALARRAHHGFGMHVLYTGGSSGKHHLELPDVDGEPEVRQAASMEELLATADVVSLHAPGGGANTHLIGTDALRVMKNTAYLINSARGDLVDTGALVAALTEGRIAGAGLDVYENEPSVSEELVELDNVVLTPHLGSATRDARRRMGMLVLENLTAFLEGREPSCRVV